MKLKEFRKTLNLSQNEIANKLGVHNTTYGNWELGKAEPDIKNLIKLAEIFNTSIDKIVGLETDIINLKGVSEKENYIIKNVLQMNELQLEKTKSYIMGLME